MIEVDEGGGSLGERGKGKRQLFVATSLDCRRVARC